MLHVLTPKLERLNNFKFGLYASFAAFSTYSCMYAFRKPFAVATFSEIEYFNIDYKILLIISQVIGYTLSKFIGLKIIAEMQANRRAIHILAFIAISELSLFLFWITPMPFNLIFMFFNGLPLGMIWGLVFSYLEGRRFTEMLAAGLSTSFIVSTGFVKSIGNLVIVKWGFSEFQMPFITGLLFIIPLLFFVWMLDQLPNPTNLDKILRTERKPMNAKERWTFFRSFALIISLLTVNYMFLTAYRDLRDNFMANIWHTLGYGNNSMIYTYTEIPIAIIVLAVMGSIMFIKNNKYALLINHYIILVGAVLIGSSTFIFQKNGLSPPIWMVFTGLGLYMAYVPFNCILFDRFIATFKIVANAGFLIYIADAFGYLSSSFVLFFKNFSIVNISWYDFYIQFSYFISITSIILSLISISYLKLIKRY